MEKKYYYLSNLQKNDLIITTLIFFIFIGFLRPLILDLEINTTNIIIYTILFFAWYGCTILFSNAFTYDTMYNKIINI
jgi:hypothetical protein